MPLTPPPLRDADIHVLVTTVEDVQRASWFAIDCLDREEMARANGYKQARHRARYQTRHVLLRHVLAAYGGWDPAGVVLGSVANGKPVIEGPLEPEISFNMSSSDNHIALAISPKVPVGIDIERIISGRYDSGLAKRFFTAEEATAIDAADQPADSFYMYWAVKESVIKVLGYGLSMPLDAVCVKINNKKKIILEWRRCNWAPSENISVELKQLECGYALALAFIERESSCTVNYITLSDL